MRQVSYTTDAILIGLFNGYLIGFAVGATKS